MGIEGFCKIAVNQFCFVCVNVFIMISGWFGIKASWKKAGALLFQVAFWGILCFLCAKIIGLPVSFQEHLLPVLLFGKHYWFVVTYLILFSIAPILNAFQNQVTKKEYFYALILFFSAELIYGFLLDTGHYAFGFSPLSFIGLYLLAGYVRRFPGKIFTLTKGYDLAIYLLVTLLSIAGIWFGYKWFGMGFHLNHYDSPLAIIASVFFFLFFSKFSFNSRIINWFAASAFAIYLAHENIIISPYYHQLFRDLKEAVPFIAFYPTMLALLLLMGLLFIMIDKPRIWIWNHISGSRNN